jgi:hypothetical protein
MPSLLIFACAASAMFVLNGVVAHISDEIFEKCLFKEEITHGVL